MEEIHFWPKSCLLSSTHLSRDLLPVGYFREQVKPEVIISRSFLSMKMSSKYQLKGCVRAVATLLFTPVTG